MDVVPAVTESLVDALKPWACPAALLNFHGPADPARVGRPWSDSDRQRLLAVKQRVDPHGMFSTGQAFC